MTFRFHKPKRPSREVGFPLSRPLARVEGTWRCPRDEAQASASRATIVVHLELGTHHAVFVRGQGGDLSWELGQPLARLEEGTWAWSTDLRTEVLKFQVLLDDLVWERGQPHRLEPGHTIHISPDFEWPEIPRVSAGRSTLHAA